MTVRVRGLGDRLAESPEGPGRHGPRWPGAPEYVRDENGAVLNVAAWCHSCELASTLSYRCSECGADLAGK